MIRFAVIDGAPVVAIDIDDLGDIERVNRAHRQWVFRGGAPVPLLDDLIDAAPRALAFANLEPMADVGHRNSNPMREQPELTASEVVEMLPALSRRTVTRWAKEGRWPGARNPTGRGWLIPADLIELERKRNWL